VLATPSPYVTLLMAEAWSFESSAHGLKASCVGSLTGPPGVAVGLAVGLGVGVETTGAWVAVSVPGATAVGISGVALEVGVVPTQAARSTADPSTVTTDESARELIS